MVSMIGTPLVSGAFKLKKYSLFVGSFHKQYKFVDIPHRTTIQHECECYANNLNKILPPTAQLDVKIKLPQKTPSYHKHLLLVSPPNLSDNEAEWKISWQSKLELNVKWPYSVIGQLKTYLKNTKEGDGVLVNAISMVRGDLMNEALPATSAMILVVPDMKIYTINEKDIKDFANFIGGGEIDRKRSRSFNFTDYLKGANEMEKMLEKQEQDVHESSHSFKYQSYPQNMVLVCGHHQRDIRCGVLAPELIEELGSTLDPETNLAIISHIGGHKYAGNVIFYNYLGQDSKENAKVDGLWFGKILPTNVPILIEALQTGNIVSEWYRGGISTRN